MSENVTKVFFSYFIFIFYLKMLKGKFRTYKVWKWLQHKMCELLGERTLVELVHPLENDPVSFVRGWGDPEVVIEL